MNNSRRFHDLLIPLHEESRGKTLGGFLHLRVTESNPDFVDFFSTEERSDELDIGTQERYILQSFRLRLFGTRPHACSFDIHADEVLVRVFLRQTYRIFPSAAAELQHDRVVIVEIPFMPMPCQVIYYLAIYQFSIFIERRRSKLEDIGESLHLSELFQFILTHNISILISFCLNDYCYAIFVILICKYFYSHIGHAAKQRVPHSVPDLHMVHSSIRELQVVFIQHRHLDETVVFVT